MNKIWQILTGSEHYYAVIDSAANNQLVATIEAYELPYKPLLEKADLSKYFCPVVVELIPNETFSEWFLTEGVAKHWGIICGSSHSLDEITEHLQPYGIAFNESSNISALMRFYDPRIFNAFLLLIQQQQAAFFAKLDYVMGAAPYREGVLKKYRMEGNDCQITAIDLAAIPAENQQQNQDETVAKAQDEAEVQKEPSREKAAQQL